MVGCEECVVESLALNQQGGSQGPSCSVRAWPMCPSASWPPPSRLCRISGWPTPAMTAAHLGQAVYLCSCGGTGYAPDSLRFVWAVTASHPKGGLQL